jgi:hypothetical protein
VTLPPLEAVDSAGIPRIVARYNEKLGVQWNLVFGPSFAVYSGEVVIGLYPLQCS